MKLSRNQLRKLIAEEKKLIERKNFHDNRQQLVAEGLGDIASKGSSFAKSGKDALAKGRQAISDVTDFVGGVKRFLEDHKEYIEPIYNLVKDMYDAQRNPAAAGTDIMDTSMSMGVADSPMIDDLSMQMDMEPMNESISDLKRKRYRRY